jgi:hypothetical protein
MRAWVISTCKYAPEVEAHYTIFFKYLKYARSEPKIVLSCMERAETDTQDPTFRHIRRNFSRNKIHNFYYGGLQTEGTTRLRVTAQAASEAACRL